MKKLWAVLKREYLERVRTKWFLVATVFGPLLFGAILYLPAYMAGREQASADVARIRILDATGERLGLPEHKIVKNIETLGNTTAGTIPLALYDAVENGRLKKGDLVLFSSVGAGFTAGASLLRWSDLRTDGRT